MSARWHLDHYERPDPTWGAEDYCPACNIGHEESCDLSTCDRPHIVAFADAELRAYAERIIRAAVRLGGRNQAVHWGPHDFDAIIAAAEADQ